jgi:two-component system OmpR family response regulator
LTNLGEDINSMTPPKVLIIEDDADLGQTLVEMLEQSGMRTAWARTGAEALALQSSFAPDVALVDLTLPDTNGMGLVTFLVRQGQCGVIIVSGLTGESDRIVGLELGADDYISKPPRLRELLARIRAVYRRVKSRRAQIAAPTPRRVVQLGKMTINLATRMAHAADGKLIALTAAEFTALETMAAAEGQPVSRDLLSERALRRPWFAESRSVDQLIFNLRQKLDANDVVIRSIRGSGYVLLTVADVKVAPQIMSLDCIEDGVLAQGQAASLGASPSMT